MRVVFDTNVVMNASFWRGRPFDCLAAWAQGSCEVEVSPALRAGFYHETFEELQLADPARKPVPWEEALTDSDCPHQFGFTGGSCGERDVEFGKDLYGPQSYPERFPYRVVYEVSEGQHPVVVAAVLHAARHDRHWQRRA